METDAPIASTSTSAVQILPYITVQHDLQEVVQDVTDGIIGAEAFWVSAYREGSPSVHGRVLVKPSLDGGSPVEFEAQGCIEFEWLSSSGFTIACPQLSIPKTSIRMPRQVHKSLMSKGIDSMDVSPNEHLYVVGGKDGALRVGNVRTNSADDIRLLKGHVGDILSCRFFPSSEVVITTSTDLSARIFSALDGSNPRTLQGHTAAVTDCAIIERGRHVLTTSNDGTMKLWLVGEAKCLKTWRFGRETRKRALKVAVIAEARPSACLDSELSGKAAVIALDDGSISLVNLEASGADPPLQTVEVSRTKKALSAVAVHRVGNSLHIATGSVDGLVSLLQLDATDLAKSARIIVQFKRNGADITSLSFARPAHEQGNVLSLLVATMDGLLFESAITTRQEDPEVKVHMEYAGYDIDACNAVVQRGSEIYSAGKDGHLRRY